MAVYILFAVLVLLVIIRFTHPTESIFYVNGIKVSCRKEDINGRNYITYSYLKAEHKIWYRTKMTRDRAYLSLNLEKVRKTYEELRVNL